METSQDNAPGRAAGPTRAGLEHPSGSSLLKGKNIQLILIKGAYMVGYTARYLKTESGYMGQLLEWPEVVTEGADIEECERSLADATNEMVLAYRELGKPIPVEHALFQTIMVEV